MKRLIVLSLLIIPSVFICFSPSKQASLENSTNAELFDTLSQWMTGHFSSAEQALKDSNFYNISLIMQEIRKDNEVTWLYVEQALSSMKDKPYRQRVYMVSQVKEGLFESKVYSFITPSRYIFAWKDSAKLQSISIDSLSEREGCSVFLKYRDGHFVGSTADSTCLSSLRGAKYATSKVSVYREKIISWDQGFDKDGKQVWGATEKGYIFEKVASVNEAE